MNYGQSQAVMVLAGERLGVTVAHAAMAKVVLEGGPLHVMHSAAISVEATELHNQIRTQPDMVAKANAHCVDLIAEYKLS